MAEVRVGAELDSTSLVLFIAACIVFWPAAAVLAYLAYDDFQKRRTGILHAIWQRLGAPAGGYAPGPHGGPPPVGPYGLPGPHGGGAPGGGYGGAPGG